MAKRRSPSRFAVTRADREHIWTISVFDPQAFTSPSSDTLAILNGSQWVRQNAGLERATLMRAVIHVNSIFTYTAASAADGPPDVMWAAYLTDEDDGTVEDPSQAGLYSEDILRFGIFNHAIRFAAANSANIAECAPSLSIDIKSRRKMTTDSQLRLAMTFSGAVGMQTGQYRAVARCLVKLA